MATVVIAPDSFKGSISARNATEALARGWRSARPQDTIFSLPMADGGEGLLDAIHSVRPDATLHIEEVTGPHGRPVSATWLQLSDSTAVIEMAQSSGLPLMDAPDPMGATSRGLGELIARAIDAGSERILVGVGGSATTDAGMGMLEGLGAVVKRSGSAVADVTSIDVSALPRPPKEGITVLADTKAVFADAPAVFGPQKGASDEQVSELTAVFERLASHGPSPTTARMPGSGAAGGVAWALASYMGAVIVEGSRYVGNLLGLGKVLDGADFVLTGEGRFDATSLSGKVVGYVHYLAKAYGVRGAVVAGTSTSDSLEEWPVISLSDVADNAEDTFSHASILLTRAAERLAREFQ
jgi:glycerate kinase